MKKRDVDFCCCCVVGISLFDKVRIGLPEFEIVIALNERNGEEFNFIR